MTEGRNISGTIFDIQGHSVHDGPGNRTLIFFKGCPLKCRWCSNPEGQNSFPEPMYLKDKCIKDALCVKGCPFGAVSISGDGLIFDRVKCYSCKEYQCAGACCSGALRIAGINISADEVLKKIKRDREFWGAEGGVTLTGGEPLAQIGFASDILKRCYESYIHTAIETCGYVPDDSFRRALPFLDWIFFDLKHINSLKHKEWTSADNDLILRNARFLDSEFKGRLIFRIAIIPGFNDSEEDIRAFADFLNSLPGRKSEVNILYLHHFGKEKYKMLGRDYFSPEMIKVDHKKTELIKKLLQENNIINYEGADTPF